MTGAGSRGIKFSVRAGKGEIGGAAPGSGDDGKMEVGVFQAARCEVVSAACACEERPQMPASSTSKRNDNFVGFAIGLEEF